MSKRFTQFSRLLVCSIACSAAAMTTVTVDSANAQQGGGYSIFKAADDDSSESEADEQSANEAFTNPAKQPTSEHVGTFAFPGVNPKAPTASTPKLDGAKPMGSYAAKTRDGRAMFSKPPTFGQKINPDQGESFGQKNTGALTPFASNDLRSPRTAQANAPAKISAQEAPKVDNDFAKSARRLSDASGNASIPVVSEGPKVAQTTFQEDRFNGFNRKPSTPLGSQGSGSATDNRQFGQGSNLTQNPSSGLRSQTFAPQRPAATRPTIPFNNRSSALNPSGRSLQNSAPQQMPRSISAPDNRVASLQDQPAPARNVRPAAQPAPKPKQSTSAKGILNNWIATDEDAQQLAGKKLTLKELLSQPINGSRKTAINQYWSTFGELAKHKIAVDHANWLSTIQNSGQQIDMAMLRAARQDAKAKVSETSIRLANSQAVLQELLPNMRDKKGNPIAALPSDIPWVGNLKTNYAEYKRRGIVPVKFNGIDKFFPKQRELISDRANGVAAAQQAANQAKVAFAARQTPIGNVLEAARLKAKSQQDFLAAVKGYNRAITDYVLTVRQDINQPTRLASVLIGSKAVRSSVARKQKPASKSVIDQPFAKSNQNPKMIPVSSQKKVAANGRESMAGQPARPNAAKQKFEYGPTKESAKASNFDPAKVEAESPFAKRKPSPATNYNSNQVGQSAPGNGIRTRSANAANVAGQNTGMGARPGQSFYDKGTNATAGGQNPAQGMNGNPLNAASRRPVGGPAINGGAAANGTKPLGTGTFRPNQNKQPLGNSSETPNAFVTPKTSLPQSSGATKAFGGSGFNPAGRQPQNSDTADRTGGSSLFRR